MASQRRTPFLRSDDLAGGLPAELQKSEGSRSSNTNGTLSDRRDMQRLGKRQQLDVCIHAV